MPELLIVSFVAGILTVLAPCVLPLLPILLGSSAIHSGEAEQKRSLKQPITIVVSLAISILVFTLLLKASTLLLGVPTQVWSVIAGGIVLLFGISMVFPSLWEKFMIVTGLQAASNRFMGKSQQSAGFKKDVLLGVSLGPVFNSCSPTYALIVAVLLPASFVTGFAYLLAYVIGLSLVLLLLAVFGKVLADKLRWLTNPNGAFKKVIGMIFIAVGVAVLFGFEKQVQTFVLENGWYDWVEGLEGSLRN